MVDNKLVDIIKTCLNLDRIACELYSRLSESAKDDKLMSFWKHMSDEEKGHIVFWAELLEMAELDTIPNIFDNPDAILNELKAIKNSALPILEDAKKNITKSIHSDFLNAFKMEFYLLHPVFETLFYYMRNINSAGVNPEQDYDKHIEQFIIALQKYASVTEEMDLLGKTLSRLWNENKKLARQSTIDKLTGILNRRGFFNIIPPLLHLSERQNLTIAFMMVDVDHFKKINDTYGHAKGDDVLRLIASSLENKVRISDRVGRYGGEEFIVLLPDTNPDHLKELGDALRINVIEKSKELIPVTVSIGIAYSKITGNIEDFIKAIIDKADQNLYKAKETGRNKVVVSGL